MNVIKHQFIRNKYLHVSVSVLIATLIMIIFDSTSVWNFVNNTFRILMYAMVASFGIFLISVFAMWLLFPFIPKYEDFHSDKEREEHSTLFSLDLLFFIFTVIAATLAFGGMTQNSN